MQYLLFYYGYNDKCTCMHWFLLQCKVYVQRVTLWMHAKRYGRITDTRKKFIKCDTILLESLYFLK